MCCHNALGHVDRPVRSSSSFGVMINLQGKGD
jgi:hypothetical protein